MATYLYGLPSTRTNGQCRRRGWDAQMMWGPPTLTCTHHARLSRRGRTHYPVCGLLWPHTTMATPVRAKTASSRGAVGIRGCHGYIPEEYIHAIYPYPLRIRAEDAYPKCIMRKKGEVISILSDKNCEIISHPYPRYESQDTGIYKIMKLLAPAEF
mgnify:CR=1 FL=1